MASASQRRALPPSQEPGDHETDNADRLTNLRPADWSRLGGESDDHPALPSPGPHPPLTDWEKVEAVKAGMSEAYYQDLKHARNLPEYEAAHAAEAERRKPKP